ncbi:MAG: hypothetical protein EBS89_06430 [Proteobacteria bacterium]|nr:hypothetical protein [Pseudomonadota bacterium]
MTAPRRIGIAGLDHWYIGREVPAVVARRDDAEVVAVAHHHAANRHGRVPPRITSTLPSPRRATASTS